MLTPLLLFAIVSFSIGPAFGQSDATAGNRFGLFADNDNMDMFIGHVLQVKLTDGPIESQAGQDQMANNVVSWLGRIFGGPWQVSAETVHEIRELTFIQATTCNSNVTMPGSFIEILFVTTKDVYCTVRAFQPVSSNVRSEVKTLQKKNVRGLKGTVSWTVGNMFDLFDNSDNADMFVGHVVGFKYIDGEINSQAGQDSLVKSVHGFLNKRFGSTWQVSADVAYLLYYGKYYPLLNTIASVHTNITMPGSYIEMEFMTDSIFYSRIKAFEPSPAGRKLF